ncbi:MAG: PilN domain-containing protein [Clostridiaceae bacterium]|nr:PilN domain-containing protein [Eubacteriales bacterium]
MRDINLIQEQASSSTSFNAKAALKPALILLGVVLLLVAGAYAALIMFSAQNVAATMAANAEAATYQPAAEAKNAVAAKQAQVGAVQELLDTAKVTGTVGTEILEKITASLTGDAFLQSVTFDDAYGLELTGTVPSRADVAGFAYNLKQTGAFDDVEISAITRVVQEKEGAAVIYSFSISALLKGGELGE